jgi:hypothetical protein
MPGCSQGCQFPLLKSGKGCRSDGVFTDPNHKMAKRGSDTPPAQVAGDWPLGR